MRFSQIGDNVVILYTRGLYKQAKLFERDHEVYAAFGSSYVRLYKAGRTSVPNITWEACEIYEQVNYDRLGKMTLDLVLRQRAA